MEDFKLNGESINFRHSFLTRLSDLLEENKMKVKFKEGTNKEQNAYYFNPESDIKEYIELVVKSMIRFKFKYSFDGINLKVEEISNLS